MFNKNRLIASIQTDVERDLKRSRIDRFIHQESITLNLRRRTQELDDAWHVFDVSVLLLVLLLMLAASDMFGCRRLV